ncbi:hypothetical protein AVEN_206913-1 [Araneus ventricosus]|uniref:Uncharacterized protein n=1 Tax=Araneus ventricosus TaxID=182803 RepID=A0A4Y2PAW1_ARAVE|nr:hypothetical protein AVEN_206913-1 [Araneus ventricosus]
MPAAIVVFEGESEFPLSLIEKLGHSPILRFLYLNGLRNQRVKEAMDSTEKLRTYQMNSKPAGVFSPKLSRILPQKGTVSPSPTWLKKFESTVTQNAMTIRRFFIIVIEKYLGKDTKEIRTDFPLLPAQGQTDVIRSIAFARTEDCFQYACAWRSDSFQK